MDILAISETSEKEKIGFLTNVEIEGYDLFHTASKISKGGTSIYANKDFESLECTDLKINNPEFESTWIEIKNKKSKNIVIGCLYIHPHNNHVEFFQYLDGCMDKLAKENKELYLCGDFNFDLLKIEYFAENVNNINKMWESIRKIVNIKNISTKSSQLNIGGKIIDGDMELATNFNNFFVNVGSSTEKTIHKVPNVSPSKFLRNRNQTNFIIAHISNEEILDIVNSLENKSTGPFSIPLKLLSLIPDLIIILLAYIINFSLSTGEFPDLLKLVKVIPIHKDGSTQDVNNFRPISLLSIFDKMIEKIMHKQLYAFLEEQNILFQNQFGFRKNNSTVYALAQITEMIKVSIDSGKFAYDTYLLMILTSIMNLTHYKN